MPPSACPIIYTDRCTGFNFQLGDHGSRLVERQAGRHDSLRPSHCGSATWSAGPTRSTLDYATTATSVKVGQLSQTSQEYRSRASGSTCRTSKSSTPNPLDTGKAWWSTKADRVDFTLAHSFDLTGATAPVFSFASYWSIEQDYDYGYVEVSTDSGATWTILKDTSGFMTNTNPNGTNQGWGLTGLGQGTVTFDLSAYIGQPIMLRLRYSTDVGHPMGWLVG